MKLVSFTRAGDENWSSGIDIGAGIVRTSDLAELVGLADPNVRLDSTRAVLSVNSAQLAFLANAAESRAAELISQGKLHPVGSVRLGPPVTDPQKIICLGLNYRDHAAEAGLTPPSAPMFFAKFANSLVGPSDAIVPPRTTARLTTKLSLLS